MLLNTVIGGSPRAIARMAPTRLMVVIISINASVRVGGGRTRTDAYSKIERGLARLIEADGGAIRASLANAGQHLLAGTPQVLLAHAGNGFKHQGGNKAE